MPDVRKCAGCGQLRDLADLGRVVVGKLVRYLCAGCELPPPRLCRVCPLPSRCRAGLCHTHRERWRRWGKPPLEEWAAAFLEERLNTCKICECHYNGYHGSDICSPECDAERRRRYALARFHAKPAAEKRAISQRAQARMAARRRAKWVQKNCAICGADMGAVSPSRVICKRNYCRRVYSQQKQDEYRRQQALLDLQRDAANLERKLADEQ